MRRLVFMMTLGMIALSACAGTPGNAAPAPTDSAIVTEAPAFTETPVPVLPTDTAAAPTDAIPNPKLPAASFDAQPYINETAGFALDYPAGWTVKEMVVGDRGSQVQFLSSPELAEAAVVPAGGTRVNATMYQWDPKNDLAAFVANQKSAWEASGFTIVEEQQRVLELGLPATQLTVQTPDAQVVYLIAALKDQYLVLSGEGDIDLVKEIVGRLRPISS